MVQTITPVVHGGSRKRWAGSLALHVLGASISAAALGALLGATGSILGGPWGRAGMLVAAVIAVAYAARELFGVAVPIPEIRRQVPEWWRGAVGPRTAAFLYGIALGPGFVTHLRHGTFVAVAAFAFALGDPLLGVALVLPFGLARAIGVAVVSAGRTEPAVMAAGDRLERVGAGSLPGIANAAALLGLAVAAAAADPIEGGSGSWAAPAVLAGTFVWGAVAKALDPSRWRESLAVHGLRPAAERATAVLVPAAEASVALLILVGSIRMGAALALGLLGAFSVALVRARRLRGDPLPCGCFGGRARRSVRLVLARNAALALLAGLTAARPVPIPLAAPSGRDAVPAALAMAGIALAAWVIRRGTQLWPRQEAGAEPG